MSPCCSIKKAPLEFIIYLHTTFHIYCYGILNVTYKDTSLTQVENQAFQILIKTELMLSCMMFNNYQTYFKNLTVFISQKF